MFVLTCRVKTGKLGAFIEHKELSVFTMWKKLISGAEVKILSLVLITSFYAIKIYAFCREEKKQRKGVRLVSIKMKFNKFPN